MNSTREQLLVTAENWVRTSGYAGFSYADLSKAVRIRKASIHHHFPTKEDLGVSLVERYRQRFFETLDTLTANDRNAISKLADYAGIYLAGLAEGRGCLCGMLASDYLLIPARVQAAVSNFFAANIRWLERTIGEGQKEGTIAVALDARSEARVFHGTILGAMFTARVLSDLREFSTAADRAVDRLRNAS
jgi:TetR/AcrR family transcriptional repressor of nem operon